MAKGRHSRGRHRGLGGQLPQTALPGSATAAVGGEFVEYSKEQLIWVF